MLLAIAAFGLAGCGGRTQHRTATDVSGWYVRDVGDGREVIDVRPNGDYVHVVTIRGASPRSDAAHWRATGDSAIELSFYRAAADVGNGAPWRDSASAAVHATPQGDLRLDVAGDSTSFVRRLRYRKR